MSAARLTRCGRHARIAATYSRRRRTIMTSTVKVAAIIGATMLAAPALAQTKVTIGISGWTGFAPLTLAKEAGIFAKNGVDGTIKKIPQATRHPPIPSGEL